MTEVCCCGSGSAYARCCARYHGGVPAPDAPTLMRSRYAAFVKLNAPYLLASWHATTRPKSVSFEPGMKWLGLKVVASRETGTGTAEVEFIARFRVGGGSAGRHHELSRFVFEDGRWFYVDGDLLASD